MKKLLQRIFSPFEEDKAYRIALRLMFLVTLVVFLGYEIFLFKNRGLHDLSMAIFLSMGLILGGFFIASHVYLQIRKLPASLVFYMGTTLTMLMILFSAHKSEMGNYLAIAGIMGFLLLIGLMVYNTIHFIRYKSPYIPNFYLRMASHFLLVACGLVVWYVFISGGLPAKPMVNAFESFQSDLSYEEIPVKYAVEKGIYGAEAYLSKYDADIELEGDTTSLSYFLGSWNDSREAYVGHNIYDAPLNGHFYMPKDAGPVPVVLLVHGNHEMVHDSEIGYDYLGTYLAERGFFVVSVDENYLNYSAYESEILDESIGNENDARAYVLLSHLRFLSKKNDLASSYFYNTLDFDNIALMGHSRGGEAVAIAEYFNEIKTLPNDYRKRLGMGYNIKSIVAIAPTDRQYKPGGRNVELENVNYMLLHGSHDMDVSYMHGNNQYERVYLDDPQYFKTAVWIYGANHGYFNETWHPGDTSPIAGLMNNTGQLMPRHQQEYIASQLIAYFLETTLGRYDYREGFKNYKAFADLPSTLYLTQYNDGRDLELANFNEDHYLETGTYPGVTLSGSGLSKWYEGTGKLKGRTSLIYGAYIGFQGHLSSSFDVDVSETDIQLSLEDAIYFSISDLTSDSTENLDFEVAITDQQGSVASVPIHQVGLLQHYVDIELTKFEMLEDNNNSETRYQSYELPLSVFEGIEHLDLGNPLTISLRFYKGNEHLLFLKDIGIRQFTKTANEK